MSRYLLTPAAQHDLSLIWDFTESRWGISQAKKYIREIQSAVEYVAQDANRGRSREEIRAGNSVVANAEELQGSAWRRVNRPPENDLRRNERDFCMSPDLVRIDLSAR